MFEGLVQPIARAVESAIARYTLWAIVAVLFLVAGGFATAALTVKLVELYGAITAFGLVAIAFAALGIMVAALAQIILSHPTSEATEPATEAAAAETATTSGAFDIPLPPELVMAALSSAAPLAPIVARSVLRNLPLLIILAIAAYLFSLTASDQDPAEQQAAA